MSTQTSTNGAGHAEPTPDGGQRIQIDLDRDNHQDNAQVPPSDSTLAKASMYEVAPNPKTKKLSLEERLGRLPEYRIRPTELESTAETTGKGGKADVVRATFKRNKGARGKRVAVKKLRFGEAADDEKTSREFVHEVELLAGLSHENIVKLVGFVEDLKHQKAWIVLSWESNGNVREFLASGKWEIPERISLIKDMFQSLKYLHTRQPPICHGDLKSLNILVSSSCRAIITDFGSARVLRNDDTRQADREKGQNAGKVAAADEGDSCPELVMVVASANQLTLTGPVWSLRWAAPELVKEEAQPGLASDIWSAGWVCWEMMTDRVPFEDLQRDCAIMVKVIQGKVPLVHEDTEVAQVIGLCSLMTDCWKFKSEDRPHVNQCCQEVQWMPSVPPLRETWSGSKELSHNLLLKMARIHYLQDRPEKAAELLEKVVTTTGSVVPREVLAEALDDLGDVYNAQCKYAKAEESYTRAQGIFARIGNDQGQANSLDGLGEVYRSQCKYAEAEESYTRAKKIYDRIGDDQGRANTLNGLGAVYRSQCKYAEAEELYTRAQEIYARIGSDPGRANTLDGLGEVYRSQCKYAEAEESYTRAQEIYARIGDDQGRANTLEGLGRIYYAQDEYAEAEELYTRAQGIHARIGNDHGRANTLNGLGGVYYAQDKYAEAEESYTRAQEIFARIGNDQGRANNLDGLGGVYRAQCKYAEAEVSYTRAHEIYARIGNDRGRADTIVGLGDIYRSQCKYAEAEESYTRAQEIHARIGNDLGRANTLDGLGGVYRSQCKYAEAEESYTRAQEIYARTGDGQGRANTIVGLGDVYRSQCKYGEAKELYTRAQEIYARIGDQLGRAHTLRSLGHLYKMQGRRIDASQVYAEARDLYFQIGLTVDADHASRCLDTVRDG